MKNHEQETYLQFLNLGECIVSALLVLSVAGLLVLGCVLAARCWDADSYPAQTHWRDDFAANNEPR